ncbi:hypothetical protein [Streptomyces sp. NBC_01506]|uniref:hypothetical protein n=1 Tax=Streptomyces sp. NBC_01506 TaxID=2903887 RepID=UPI0038687BCC
MSRTAAARAARVRAASGRWKRLMTVRATVGETGSDETAVVRPTGGQFAVRCRHPLADADADQTRPDRNRAARRVKWAAAGSRWRCGSPPGSANAVRTP